MIGNPRIDELRRRVQADPTSIAFAALAEEYRRAGQFEQAVEVCRSGLHRHPAYLSARVTLARALIELNQLDEAGAELQKVLSIAPENLAAIRALAEVQARRGEPLQPETSRVPLPSAVKQDTPFELDLFRPGADVQSVQAAPAASAASVGRPSAVTTVTPPVPLSAPPATPPALIPLQRFLDAVLLLKSHSA